MPSSPAAEARAAPSSTSTSTSTSTWVGPALLVVALSGAALASRAPPPGPVMVARSIFFVFAAFALAGFVLCLRAADRPSFTFRQLLWTAVLCQLAVAPALPFTSRDLFANFTYARILEGGGNPYLTTPRVFFNLDHGPAAAAAVATDPFALAMDPRWWDTACVYSPLVTGLNLVAVVVGRTPGGALWVAKLFALCAALLGIALAARRAGARDDRVAFALLGLNPLYAWELSGQAHSDVYLVPLLLGFCCALSERRLRAAAFWAGVSMLVKPIILPVLALALVVPLRRTPRAQALGLIATMLAIVTAVLVLGWAPLWSGRETITIIARSLVGGHVDATNSITEALRALAKWLWPGTETTVFHVCRVLGLGAAALVGLGALRRVRDEADVIDEGLMVNLVFFTLVAWFQPWYVTWLLPFALVARDRNLARVAALYGAALLPGYVTGLYVTSWIAHAAVFTVVWRSGRLFGTAKAQGMMTPGQPKMI